ncbi:MAG: putative DNA binding domain-containing protein [Ignavibacteriae bacterium]|nr:putative DNA binding domain-containing protein [Ignavibacteriota bacterium]
MDERIKEIIDIPSEDRLTEFKRLGGESRIVSKTIETIVAMANTEGGQIILGVDDPEKSRLKGEKRIFGIEENKELFDEIGREISRITSPLNNLWPPELIEYNKEKTIAVINISKSTDNFHQIDNQVFIRLEKGNKRLTPHEIVKLSYAKGFSQADKELVDIDVELLNTQSYKNWILNRGIPESDISDVLLNTGLARRNESNIIKPTAAAVMLFALYPSDLLDTKCEIRIFQYLDKEEKIVSDTLNYSSVPHTIKGPVIKQIKDAHDYVLNLLKAGMRIPDSGFINTYTLPERTVKEAITNAVIHRDYYIKRPLEIRIFTDRIEVESPGLFPSNITQSNIGKVRAESYRNNLIVKHLREFPVPPNLDQNEGIKLLRKEMNDANLFPPVFLINKSSQDSIILKLYFGKRNTEWNIISNYLSAKEKYINNEKVRDLLNEPKLYKVSRLLSKWNDMGILIKLEKIGTKSVRYRLPESFEN